MKRSDKYPPGTEEDARSLPTHTTVMGLHPLIWGMIAVFMLAGVGLYSEMVGFYELDDFGEVITGEESDDDEAESDDEESDDSEDALPFVSPDQPDEKLDEKPGD